MDVMFVENLGEIGMAAGLLLVILAVFLPWDKTDVNEDDAHDL